MASELIGTLKELNVQPGDVVEYCGHHKRRATVSGWCNGRYYSTEQEIGGFESLDSHGDWRIVSRAADAPTGPVRTVTRKEIVPGEYAHALHISAGRVGEVGVSFGGYHFRHLTAEQLRAAIATLTEIADALEANQ